MTHAARSPQVAALGVALRDVGRRRRVWWRLARLLQGIWWWMLAALLVLIADALQPMPPWLRLGLTAALLVAIPALLWRMRVRLRDRERAALHDAAHLEQRHRIDDNSLVNGLMLAPLGESSGDPLVRGLAQRSAAYGYATLATVDRDVVVDRAAARRQALGVVIAAAAWGALFMLFPHLMTGGAARFLTPHAGTPPFSLTRVEAALTTPQVPVGGDAVVTATLTGRPAASAELVELDAEGKEIRRWPMQLQEDGTFTRTLRSLREPMAVRIEAGDGRSRVLQIAPGTTGGQPHPTEPSQTREAAEPAPEAGAGGATSAPAPSSGRDDPASDAFSGSLGAAAEPDSLPEPTGVARRGVYSETAAGADQDLSGADMDSFMQHAPPSYRPLIRRYFERINADQAEDVSP